MELLFVHSLDALAKSASFIFIRWWSASIATIPLDRYSDSAASAIIGVFALWGLSQLMIGLIYLVAAIRYRSMIPLLYLLSLFEYLVRATYIPAYKSIETVGTAPGAAGNLPLVIFSFTMLVLSLWSRKKTA